MKQVTIEVSSCRNCLFSEVAKDSKVTCYIPEEINTDYLDITDYFNRASSPDNCPLKKQSLKIEFKK